MVFPMSPGTDVKHLHCYSCLDGLSDTAVLGSGSRWIKAAAEGDVSYIIWCSQNCIRGRFSNGLEVHAERSWWMLYRIQICMHTYKFLSKEGQIFSYPWFQWCLGDTLQHFWKLPGGRYASVGLNPVENLPNRVKVSSSNTGCPKVKCLP